MKVHEHPIDMMTCLFSIKLLSGFHLLQARFLDDSPIETTRLEAKTPAFGRQGMDPHQRVVLEVGYEACHHAGYSKGKLMNKIGALESSLNHRFSMGFSGF